MAESQSYYNSLPECSIVDYEVIPLPEAALLWCGVKFEDLAEEVKMLVHISQSIYKHPYIPCLEKKTRVLNEAVNNGSLRAVRENGEGGKDRDHVAYNRRHFWIGHLKQFIADNYPNDRPKTIFNDEELKAVIDVSEYERMSNEYQKILAEKNNFQIQISELKTELASKRIELQIAKSAQNDAEERLDKGRALYKDLREKYNKSIADNTCGVNIDNALYLMGEILNVLKSPTSPAKKWTQQDIINAILQDRENKNKNVQGLEQRKIDEYFSQANKRFKAN